MFDLGLPIDDELLVCMLIEYIKNLDDIRGWVIINFPETLEQARLFELALSTDPNINIKNITSPTLSVYDLCHMGSRYMSSTNAAKRQSRLLKKPEVT